jgi:sec-independent protein translocase protein TatB
VFDIGFMEIMVIVVIGLIVIGPERMPEVARKIGSFVGKTRNFINTVKQDNQIQETVDDFKKSMNLEEEQKKITQINDELTKGLSMGMDDIDLDQLKRPFNQPQSEDTEEQKTVGSQFNKAPAQPVPPQPASEQIPESTVTSSEKADTPSQSESASEELTASKPSTSSKS